MTIERVDFIQPEGWNLSFLKVQDHYKAIVDQKLIWYINLVHKNCHYVFNILVCLFFCFSPILQNCYSYEFFVKENASLFFAYLLTLIACRPGTIFFGSPGPRALKNTHSNYSTSVLVLFFSLSKTLPSKPFDICQFVRKYCPNANFAMLQLLMCVAESFLFVSLCMCVSMHVGNSVFVYVCMCLLGLSSWKHTHG